MADINNSDDYLHRLGKLVPVYVIAWLTIAEGLLRIFVDDLFIWIGSLLVIGFTFGLIYVVEIVNQQIERRDQLLVLIISSLLFTGIFLIRIYVASEPQLDALIALVTLGWTFLVPQAVK